MKCYMANLRPAGVLTLGKANSGAGVGPEAWPEDIWTHLNEAENCEPVNSTEFPC